MATITKRTSKTGEVSYRVQIRISKDGKQIASESATFPTKTLAKEYAKKREAEYQQSRIAHRQKPLKKGG